MPELFNPQGQYRYTGGVNVAGMLAWVIAGGLAAMWSQYAFVIGFPAGFVAYLILMKVLVLPRHPQAELGQRDGDAFLAASVGKDWVHTGDGAFARVDCITLMPGGPALVATMRANGAYAALVSGGFTSFTAKIAAVLGFDENRANTLLSDGDVLSGTVADPILGKQAKVDALADICARLGISETDVLAVGDGANDLGMLKRAGAGVALHAKPVVAAECDIRINHGDLTALLFLQGYRREEFV